MMGTSGLAGDPAYPPKEAMMPPVPMGKSGQAIAKGFNKLGWHWWPSDTAIATLQYDRRTPRPDTRLHGFVRPMERKRTMR